MSLKDQSVFDRRKTAAEAKAQLLKAYKSRPGPEDPARAAFLAERKAIAEARAAREAAKEEARRIAEEKALEEKLLREEAERVAAAAREAERLAEEARLAAKRPSKILRDAAQYAALRAAGRGRRG